MKTKKAYAKPVLKRLGLLRRLTRGVSWPG